MEFKKVKLGEVARVKNGYAFKSKDFTDYGIPIIKIKNICPPLINIEECNYVSEELYNQTSQYCILKGDILISMTGSGPNQMNSAVGKVGRYLLNRKALQNQRVGKIEIIDEKKYDKDFLYYYLSQKNILEYFVNNSTGSANQANISKKIIENLMVPDFLKSTQRKIANILNALDSKIEINNKIISNLESQAQAIFKSWFVDFEPFQDGDFVESELGMIPEGWEVKELGELFKFVKGKKPKDLHEKYEDNFIPYIVKGVMDGSETPKFTNEINIVKIKKLDCFMLMDGANSGNIYYGYDGALGSTFALLESKSEVFRELIYWKLKTNESLIKNQNTGSAIPHANKDFISKMQVAIPTKIEENEILKTLENFRIKINSLNNQNTKLAELRDALLPKLMTGEIDVSNIKIEGEEVKNE